MMVKFGGKLKVDNRGRRIIGYQDSRVAGTDASYLNCLYTDVPPKRICWKVTFSVDELAFTSDSGRIYETIEPSNGVFLSRTHSTSSKKHPHLRGNGDSRGARKCY
jgi:hypothetical protein